MFASGWASVPVCECKCTLTSSMMALQTGVWGNKATLGTGLCVPDTVHRGIKQVAPSSQAEIRALRPGRGEGRQKTQEVTPTLRCSGKAGLEQKLRAAEAWAPRGLGWGSESGEGASVPRLQVSGRRALGRPSCPLSEPDAVSAAEGDIW